MLAEGIGGILPKMKRIHALCAVCRARARVLSEFMKIIEAQSKWGRARV